MTTDTKSPTTLVWCDPVTRGDLKLAAGDITEAIKWFDKTTGRRPILIEVCPVNEKFANEVPDGITFKSQTGVLLWEIRLTGETRDLVTTSTTESSRKTPETRCNQILPCNNGIPKGLIPPENVTENILMLAGNGKSSRRISDILKSHGIYLSHMTVARRIKENQRRLL